MAGCRVQKYKYELFVRYGADIKNNGYLQYKYSTMGGTELRFDHHLFQLPSKTHRMLDLEVLISTEINHFIDPVLLLTIHFHDSSGTSQNKIFPKGRKVSVELFSFEPQKS